MRIVIEGIDVDYPDDIKITIKRSNPFFESTGINEGASYSFSINKTPSIYKLLFLTDKKEFEAKIFINSLLFVSGKVVVNKEKGDQININLIEDGTNLRKKMSDISFDELQLEKVTVCDPGDDAPTKLTKWKNHMVDNTLNTSVDEGTHKFPKISAYQGYGDGINGIFHLNNRFINAYVLNDYHESPAVPNGYSIVDSDGPYWFWTVSPCIKMNYLFTEVINYLNITLGKNVLEDIPEFNQLYHFNGNVLDETQIFGSNYYNVHADEYDLTDFLPDNNLYSLFELFNELFDAFFIYTGNELNVKLKKDIINQKAIDLSKYCAGDYNKSRNVSTAFVIGYLYDEDLNPFYDSNFKYQYAASFEKIYPFTEFTVNDYSSLNKKNAFELKHIPLKSLYWYLFGVWTNISDFNGGLFDTMLGWNEWTSFTSYPLPIKSSIDHDNYQTDVEDNTVFNCGLLRGQFDTRLDNYSYPGPILTGHSPVNHMYNYSFRNIQIIDSFLPDMVNYIEIFGNSSLYLNAEDGLYNGYKKPFVDFMKESQEITKEMWLPIHKAIEIASFKEPKHIIKQRNMSFEGIAKEVTFTLMKDGISETSIVYVVKSKEAVNHFSDDFNDDYFN